MAVTKAANFISNPIFKKYHLVNADQRVILGLYALEKLDGIYELTIPEINEKMGIDGSGRGPYISGRLIHQGYVKRLVRFSGVNAGKHLYYLTKKGELEAKKVIAGLNELGLVLKMISLE